METMETTRVHFTVGLDDEKTATPDVAAELAAQIQPLAELCELVVHGGGDGSITDPGVEHVLAYLASVGEVIHAVLAGRGCELARGLEVGSADWRYAQVELSTLLRFDASEREAAVAGQRIIAGWLEQAWLDLGEQEVSDAAA